MKVPLRLEPTPFTAVIIAIAIPAAISPYSIAVAPASSFKNFKTNDFMVIALISCFPERELPSCFEHVEPRVQNLRLLECGMYDFPNIKTLIFFKS